MSKTSDDSLFANGAALLELISMGDNGKCNVSSAAGKAVPVVTSALTVAV